MRTTLFPHPSLRRTAVVAVAVLGLASGVGGAASAAASRADHGGRPSVTSRPWGSVDGQPVNLYTLKSGHHLKVTVTNFGATVQGIWVRDRHGRQVDVALGFPTLSDYVNDFLQQHTGVAWPMSGGSGDTYFGGTIGRYANRIGDHSFTMHCSGCSNDGVTYTLPANNGTNTLHGGDLGWNTMVWSATMLAGRGTVGLRLTLHSADGDEGFPAAMTTTVTYLVGRDDTLKIKYRATNDEATGGKATVVNLTNHTYFNLAGESSGPVNDQRLKINADTYSPIDTSFIPTPPYALPVAGTAFDFRHPKPIGRDITDASRPDGTSAEFPQLIIAHGYDHNWILNGSGYRLAAVADDPHNGVVLRTYTDQPGVQFYSGNFLVGDLTGTGGHAYRQTSGFTLETQHFPDTPHHIGQAGWPSVVLNAGDTMASTTAYQFSTRGRGRG